MSLDPHPARPLTSREIAKIISGLLGSLAQWCSVDDIMEALEHFERNKEEYMSVFKEAQKIAKEIK